MVGLYLAVGVEPSNYFIRSVRKEAKNSYYFRHIRPSVSMSTRISVSHTRRIFMKFYIGNVYENLSRNDSTHKMRLCFYGKALSYLLRRSQRRMCVNIRTVTHCCVVSSTMVTRARHKVTFCVPCLSRS
jgi:hypothetical protein